MRPRSHRCRDWDHEPANWTIAIGRSAPALARIGRSRWSSNIPSDLRLVDLSDRRLASSPISHWRTKWSVGVIIPARNEETTIESCIASVVQALARARVDHWIVVVADLCDDRTAARARRVLGDAGEVIEVSSGSAGIARRAGVAKVLEHWDDLNPSQLW
jgi:cellulose synthase/poly-beta-1,6-N-acetylglucosamine synthase-like glycosyltransferase